MGKKLYEEVGKEEKGIIDGIFENVNNGEELKRVLFEGSAEELKNTEYAQPGISLISVILTKL